MSVFLISGFCAAVAGVITAGRTNAGFPTAGQLQELASISAVIIGGASFWGGRGTVTGAVVGAFIFGIINNGLNLLNVSVYWQLIAIGLILVIAVELDVLRRELEERFRTLQAHGSSAMTMDRFPRPRGPRRREALRRDARPRQGLALARRGRDPRAAG